MEFHHASVFEAIADQIPDALALAQGERSVTYRQMDERTARLAAFLADAGLTTQSKVAINMYNCLEWLEAFYGAVKNRFVPVSINYRYVDDELAYLFENSGAEAVVFHASLAERVVRVAKRFPAIKALVQVDDLGGVGAAPLAEGVVSYDDVVTNYRKADRISRDPGDIFMWYSGGTTGLPKGMEIPIGGSAVHSATREGRIRTLGLFGQAPESLPEDPIEGAVLLNRDGGRPIALPAAPLMHSTALSYCGPAIFYCGGAVVTLESHSFDANELFEAVNRWKVTTITIVGDPFAKPMTRALEERAAAGQPYDASSLRTIYSAGVVWSADVKSRLFEHIPQVILVDNCGSSEGAWYGTSVLRKGDSPSSAMFHPAPGVLVLDEAGNPMPPGTGKPGLLASLTANKGYYNDPEKTKQNFRMINGSWYTVPGDYGLFNEDGTMVLLGRGTSVINTGGEKVHPEEVDDVVKTMPDVDDCLVVGTPDERWGQAVTAVVQLRPGATMTADDVTQFVKTKLAAYKAPRRVVFVTKVPRLPNGKPDYPTTKKIAEDAVTAS